MALPLRFGTARSLSRARARPAARAGLRSSAAAAWTATRDSSNLSGDYSIDDFVEKVVEGDRETPRSETDPSSLPSTHDDASSTPSTPTQTAELESSPSVKIRKIKIATKIREISADPALYAVQRLQTQRHLIQRPQEQEAKEGLVREVPLAERMVRRTQNGSDDPLLRKYKFPDRQLVFSRPRAVVLQQLPLGTTGGDVVRALEKAADANRLPHWASRLRGVRVESTIGDEKFITARVDFLHPDGAKAVHCLVEEGQFQVKEAVPTASLLQDIKADLRSNRDTGIGIVASQEERARYFTSQGQRKLIKKYRI